MIRPEDEIRRLLQSPGMPAEAKERFLWWLMRKIALEMTFKQMGDWLGVTKELVWLLSSSLPVWLILKIGGNHVLSTENYPYISMIVLVQTVALMIVAYCGLWFLVGSRRAEYYAGLTIWGIVLLIATVALFNLDQLTGPLGGTLLHLAMGCTYLTFFSLYVHYALFFGEKIELSFKNGLKLPNG